MKPYSIVAGLASLLTAIPAFGQFTPISTPAGAYLTSTAVIPIAPTNGTSVSSLTGGGQTVTLSTALSAQTVPSGGWSTWGTPPNTESATPRVLARYSSLTSFTLTLSTPVTTFGFELESATFGAFSVTADFMNGSTVLGSITRSPNGNAGALLFAATSSTPITSVVLTVPAGANGFAIAQIRSTASSGIVQTPAPSTAGLATIGLLLVGISTMVTRWKNRVAGQQPRA